MLPHAAPPKFECSDGICPGLTEGAFRSLYEYYYSGGHWYAYLGQNRPAFRVIFRTTQFDHAFYKEAHGNTKHRTVWQPERASRLLWIGYTVENPSRVLQDSASSYLFMCRMNDGNAPWFFVVADGKDPLNLTFVTAHPLDHAGARSKKQRARRILYERV